jgi:SRSO17 transposase
VVHTDGMKPQELQRLDCRLEHFLEQLLGPMGRSERRHWARIYIEGLLLDGERKSIEPIANRIHGANVQSLRQFVGQSPWSVEEIQHKLTERMVDLLSEPEVWVLDETSFPKAGEHSVGVARQYCGALGKIANCQVAVSLHWSSMEFSCPMSWRLYLPPEWFADPQRAAEVKLPVEINYQSKTKLALDLIDQALSWEIPVMPVVADSFYGNDFGFRENLRQRQLPYVLAVEPTTVVWRQDPNLPLPPPQKTGRPRQFPPLESLPQPEDLLTLAQKLPLGAWQMVTWRKGSQAPQRSRFAKLKIWAAHGWRKKTHPDRVPEWLLIEWPSAEEKPTKYWLGQLGFKTPGLRRLVRIAHSRWRIELDYRELKDELGLDHYEGRQWMGWHHHVTLVSMAYAFLRAEQARLKKNFWCDLASGAPQTSSQID